MNHSILSVTVYKVTTGGRDAYLADRASRLDAVRSQRGVQLARGLESVTSYTKSGAEGVYMELVQWASLAAADAAPLQPAPDALASNIASGRFDSLGGRGVDLAARIRPGQAIEFGLRRIRPSKQAIFGTRRAAFMRGVKENPGVCFDFELRSVDGDDLSMVLFGWDSLAHFEAAGRRQMWSPGFWWQALRYFPLMRQVTFQVGVVDDVSEA